MESIVKQKAEYQFSTRIGEKEMIDLCKLKQDGYTKKQVIIAGIKVLMDRRAIKIVNIVNG